MNELLDKSAMKNTKILEVYNLASLILQNESGIKFQIDTLPFMAQISPIYSILSDDLNNDGYVSIDEINQSTNIIFQLIDTNGDKKISLLELEELKNIINILK